MTLSPGGGAPPCGSRPLVVTLEALHPLEHCARSTGHLGAHAARARGGLPGSGGGGLLCRGLLLRRGRKVGGRGAVRARSWRAVGAAAQSAEERRAEALLLALGRGGCWRNGWGGWGGAFPSGGGDLGPASTAKEGGGGFPGGLGSSSVCSLAIPLAVCRILLLAPLLALLAVPLLALLAPLFSFPLFSFPLLALPLLALPLLALPLLALFPAPPLVLARRRRSGLCTSPTRRLRSRAGDVTTARGAGCRRRAGTRRRRRAVAEPALEAACERGCGLCRRGACR